MTLGPLGVALAGGESSRYGSPKALATIAGDRVIDRVLRALRAVVPEVVLIANEPALFQDLDLPTRPDVQPGLGPVGGIYTALLWAAERGHPGTLAVACDMPFVTPPLLRLLLQDTAAADAVIPDSPGRRGLEPLCAYYATSCLGPLERAIARGDQRMIGFHAEIAVRRVPVQTIAQVGDPGVLFFNINTMEDRERAESIAGEAPAP